MCTIFTSEGHPVFIVLLGAMDVKGLLKAVGEPALMKYVSYFAGHFCRC